MEGDVAEDEADGAEAIGGGNGEDGADFAAVAVPLEVQGALLAVGFCAAGALSSRRSTPGTSTAGDLRLLLRAPRWNRLAVDLKSIGRAKRGRNREVF
jgi:hypothetical protein